MQFKPGVLTNSLGITNEDIQDTLGHACPVRQLSQGKRRQRRRLCRFQNYLQCMCPLLDASSYKDGILFQC